MVGRFKMVKIMESSSWVAPASWGTLCSPGSYAFNFKRTGY